jgi:hypothetical protein
MKGPLDWRVLVVAITSRNGSAKAIESTFKQLSTRRRSACEGQDNEPKKQSTEYPAYSAGALPMIPVRFVSDFSQRGNCDTRESISSFVL